MSKLLEVLGGVCIFLCLAVVAWFFACAVIEVSPTEAAWPWGALYVGLLVIFFGGIALNDLVSGKEEKKEKLP